MASDAEHATERDIAQQARKAPEKRESSHSGKGRDRDRLLTLLAAERLLRAVLLIGVGVVLLTHLHENWAADAHRFVAGAGLDPSHNETGKLVSRLAGFGPRQVQQFGVIAIGYGLLETAEGYGLLRHRLWGEYLTIVGTALLIIPEVDELLKHPTALKVGGLVLNALIVAYLVARLVRRRRSAS